MKYKKHKKNSQEFWNKHLESWKASGLTQSWYCKQNSIDLKAFGKKKVLRFGTDKNPRTEPSLDLVALPLELVRSESHISLNTEVNTGINISIGSKANIKISKNFDHICLSEILSIVSNL
jgi:hypothetical protein